MRCSAGARTAPSTGLPQQGTARFNDSDLSGFTVEVSGADNRRTDGTPVAVRLRGSASLYKKEPRDDRVDVGLFCVSARL